MKKKRIIGWLILFAALSAAALAAVDPPAGAPPEVPGAVGYGEQLGTVTLPFSCNEGANIQARRGLALLHHMTYEGARDAFLAATQADPNCALGYWGQAMSYIHPLWSDPPEPSEFERGKAQAAEALARTRSERERAYVAPVTGYYAQGSGGSEADNLAAFAEGWRKAYAKYPDDPEAATFYALAHLATASPADKSYAVQKESARIARQVLERYPDHPGAHHYTIHALDYPPLAAEALEVARSYGEIAPEVPHALHMPGHIFTRLGLWQESIDMNRRSADAARKHPADGKVAMHYLHALDYLAYAYLQRGEDAKASEVLEEMQSLQGPYQTHVGSAYALAAVPARIALEGQQWSAAAGLQAQRPRDYAWQDNPAMEAITHFARGIGAARSGDPETARQALKRLAELEKRAEADSEYWGKQVEIERLSAEAWLAYLEGRKEEALSTMRRAAEKEAATEKHPVTPGEVLPAHELLADMLLEMGLYQEAESNYRASLERTPNRFNSLYGAARAAELAGREERAANHYRQLVEVAAAGSDRRRLEEAKAYLDRK